MYLHRTYHLSKINQALDVKLLEPEVSSSADRSKVCKAYCSDPQQSLLLSSQGLSEAPFDCPHLLMLQYYIC